MKSSSTTTLALWGVALVVALGSLAVGYLHLDGLPDLGVQLGPDLTVRSVSLDRDGATERQEFKRGDRLVALQGQSVEDLRDLRTVLQHLPAPTQSASDADGSAEGAAADQAPGAGAHTVTYQLIRPLHRFAIALQGEIDDPTALPPGVEPTDRLVELDYRPLNPPVGAEAVRSIMASRPEAQLIFERTNAVFSGTMTLPAPDPPYGVFGAFGLVILVLIALWIFRAEELEPAAVVAVGLETVCIGWIALLAFHYQWTLSDYGLTGAVLAAFILVRPFAFFARNLGEGRGSAGGWIALLIGVVATGTALGLLFGGHLGNAEEALHLAALMAGLFIVYEIFLASVDDNIPESTLGEGTGYLAWILVLALFAALLAWYLEPISFAENRWRWFASVIVGLVWFGDVLYCFRGPSSAGYAAIASSDERRDAMLTYLAEARERVPEARLFFVAATPEMSVLLEPRSDGLRIGETSNALHDAVSILIQESVRVPLPEGIHRQAHPMGGIAKTMNMAIALRLAPPESGMRVEGLDLVLVGIEEAPSGELPLHPSVETIDDLQHHLSAEVWTAALIEAMTALIEAADLESEAQPKLEASPDPARVEELEREVESLRAEVEAAKKPEPAQPEQQPKSKQGAEAAEPAADINETTELPVEPLDAAPAAYEQLLEPELIAAIDYLLDSAEPIVLAGAAGAGKRFIARCAHEIEGRGEQALMMYDAGSQDADAHLRLLFGEAGGGPGGDGIIGACQGRALAIRGAGLLSDAIILRLCQAAETGDIRLYLAVDDDEAEARSVLEERTQELQELLEHRELIVPRFAHRRGIVEAVLEFFLDRERRRGRTEADAFDEAALEALLVYGFPGEIEEARTLVESAAARAEGSQIELEDLGFEVREAFADQAVDPPV